MKFKQFLKKWVINNIGLKILAIVFAFVLWLVIVNIQDPEITRTVNGIPVSILNEDTISENEYVYAVASGDTVNLVVTGKRSIVNYLSASDFEATADFRELSMTNAVPITVKMTGSLAKYENQLMITQKNMSMVLKLEGMASKMIDVELRYLGQQQKDMIIDDAVVEPAQIEVTAPVSVLANISRAEALVDLENVADGAVLRATPTVYNLGGGVVEAGGDISFSTDEVNVSFATSHTKQVGVTLLPVGVPAEGYELTNITKSFDSVILKGKEEVLEKVYRVTIPGSMLDINGAVSDTSVTVNLGSYIPEGTEIYDNNVNITVKAIIDPIEGYEAAETEAEVMEKGITK